MEELSTLNSQLASALADLQGAAEFLKSPFFHAQLSESLAAAHVQVNSPWLDRKAAAAYAHCSTSEVDRAANAGVFKRYFRAGTPLFKKAEIDAAIERGEWRKVQSKAA